MLTLNKSNGEIKVDEYIFNANTTALELESLSTKYVVKSHTTNTGSNFYNILDLDSGESALQFIFRDNKLKTIKNTKKKY